MKKVIKWFIYLSILVLTLFLIIKVIEKNKIEYNNEYFNIEKDFCIDNKTANLTLKNMLVMWIKIMME